MGLGREAARAQQAQQAQQALLAKRVLGGALGLAQLWFREQVLDKYRGASGYRVLRTDTVGRLRGPQWTLDFGIAGPDEGLIHVSAADASERIPAGERDHWAAHAGAVPASANFVLMQLTRGACVDDGDVRPW